jgi:hypothetical protein
MAITEWPSQLKTLHLNSVSNIYLDYLPNTLTDLKLHFDPESHVRRYLDHLPSSLTRLEYEHTGVGHEISLDHLPAQLHTLIINVPYNKPLDHLPSSLQVLKISSRSHQSVDHLPINLKVLEMSNKFNQPMDHLPVTLTELKLLSEDFCQSLDYLPISLRVLIIDNRFFSRSLDHLPEGLQLLNLNYYRNNLDYLPSTLLHLINMSDCYQYCGRSYRLISCSRLQTLAIDSLVSTANLPPNLYQLQLKYGFLPRSLSACTWQNLRKLDCDLTNVSQTPVWPPGLTHLIIRNNNSHIDLGILPETLQYLTIDELNTFGCTRWPDSLHYLNIEKRISATSVPQNHIQTLSSWGWHKVLNRVEFPYLKRITIVNDIEFNWDLFHSTTRLNQFDCFLCNVYPHIPPIWPLRLFYLSLGQSKTLVNFPGIQPFDPIEFDIQ